jgi:hypothetical protein
MIVKKLLTNLLPHGENGELADRTVLSAFQFAYEGKLLLDKVVWGSRKRCSIRRLAAAGFNGLVLCVKRTTR